MKISVTGGAWPRDSTKRNVCAQKPNITILRLPDGRSGWPTWKPVII